MPGPGGRPSRASVLAQERIDPAENDPHSSARARDRLRDRLRARLEGDNRPVAQKLRDRMDDKLPPSGPEEDMDKEYGKETAEAMRRMLLAAWNSPKWQQAEEAAIKIRDNPDLDSCEKGYLQAKLLECAASP